MTLIIPMARYICWIILAIVAIYWLVIRFIVCPLYSHWKAKKEKDEWYLEYKWSIFTDNFEIWFIASVFITLLITILMAIGIGLTEAQIYENHEIESSAYAMYETEYNTLNRIIETSTDVVNSDIYSRINEYNKEVVAIQSKYNTPSFAFNFTGKCDWNNLQLITLQEKLNIT